MDLTMDYANKRKYDLKLELKCFVVGTKFQCSDDF